MNYVVEYLIATGYGLGKMISKCDSYTNAKRIAKDVIEHYSNKGMKVEKVIYHFPSGKQFVEKIA